MFESSQNPCLLPGLLHGIGAGVTIGAAYNMMTSRNPVKVVFVSYMAVCFGSV